MYFLGLISGTSMDAVDAALVRFGDRRCEDLCYRQYPFSDALGAKLKSISATTPLSEVVACDAELGDLFADCAIELAHTARIPWARVAAVGCHGQTVLHRPEAGVRNTLQLGDPNRIAWRTGVPVVSDFRRMDMAAGGQGAPLAPAFHEFLFRDDSTERAVLNIGGIANITILPRDPGRPVSGFDTGPGNTLLDQWMLAHRREPFDRDGRWSAAGKVDTDLLQMMLTDLYFAERPPKSTGRERFNLDWVNSFLERCRSRPEARDVQSTLAELTAFSIADAIHAHARDAALVIACGGGVHNADLMRRLRDRLAGTRVESTERHGLSPDAVEAVTFAWLARRRLDGAAGNIPSVSGASELAVLGAIYQPKPRSSAG